MPIFSRTEWSCENLILPHCRAQIDEWKNRQLKAPVFQGQKFALSRKRVVLSLRSEDVSSAIEPRFPSFPFNCASLKSGRVFFGWSVNLPLDGGIYKLICNTEPNMSQSD